MTMHPTVEKHLDQIRSAAERYGVEKLEIFGSVMTPEFDPERSDVDFIVHYPPEYTFGPFGKKLFDLENEITSILGRDTQLVMTSALKKHGFRQSANLTRKTIYDSSALDTSVSRHTNPLSVHS